MNAAEIASKHKFYGMDIKKIVSQSKSVPRLEKCLADNGFRFKSLKKLKNFVNKEIQKANKDLIGKISESPFNPVKELSYSEVKLDGVKYRIHGVVHGIKPFFGLKKQVSNFIESYISAHDHDGEGYVMESHFSTVFKLDKAREISNRYAYERMDLSDMLDLLAKVVYVTAFAPVACVEAPLVIWMKSYKYDGTYYTVKSMSDMKYLPKARKIFPLTRMPEPLGMHVDESIGGFDKFNALRSAEMAGNMVAYAKRNELGIVHALVGLGHEDQIKHCLNEYPLELLLGIGNGDYKRKKE